MEQQFKFFAFISYNSKDLEWGKRLQRKLEHYRIPAALCSERGWKRTPIKPVFFAPTDIQPGGLSEELQERLKTSRNLIVICSPNSARSEWVGKEIAFFHQLGRTKQIHFFIVDGIPNSGNPDTECFNPIVKTLGLPEILGANIHEKIFRWPWLNKERAYVQLVSKLLGVEFNTIWQRHKRLLIQKVFLWWVGICLVLAALIGVWFINQPVDVEVGLNEVSVQNNDLPPMKDAVVRMTVDNETKVDTLNTHDEIALFRNIPFRFLNKTVRMQVECRDFLTVDTVVTLAKNIVIPMRRNPDVYGRIRFLLWNPHTEQTAPYQKLMIDSFEAKTDAEGYVEIDIPLSEQKRVYRISSETLALEDSVVTTPCGPDDAIRFK